MRSSSEYLDGEGARFESLTGAEMVPLRWKKVTKMEGKKTERKNILIVAKK